MRIRFDRVEGFIRVFEGAIYLVSLGPEKYDAVYNRSRYLISQKNGITDVFFHNSSRIKIDSFDALPLKNDICFA